MEMNDILNGLNSCDDDCSESTSNCSCGPNFVGPGIGGFPGGFGGGFGQGTGNTCSCGFGSWIWILLILFYCGCGRNNNYGRGRNNCCECCCEKKCCDCCCEKECCCCNQGNAGGSGNGFLSNCSPYLFILVILFLCNNNYNNSCFCGGGAGTGYGGGFGGGLGAGFGGGLNGCNGYYGCGAAY